jgi:hypothetical protein
MLCTLGVDHLKAVLPYLGELISSKTSLPDILRFVRDVLQGIMRRPDDAKLRRIRINHPVPYVCTVLHHLYLPFCTMYVLIPTRITYSYSKLTC